MYAKGCGIGSIGTGVYRGIWHSFTFGIFECQAVGHRICWGVWHRFHRYAGGSGIGSISMPGGMAYMGFMGMLRDLALEMRRGLELFYKWGF